MNNTGHIAAGPVSSGCKRLPDWLKIRIPVGKTYFRVNNLLKQYNLNTVCADALCPNRGECFASGTATFLILGRYCTRNCRYCNITCSIPAPPDSREPENLARACSDLALNHIVVTSVTRDDLPDGGASQFYAVVQALRTRLPEASVELLIPDLQGNPDALRRIIAAQPEVINHNLETVARLFPTLRPRGNYARSLEVLGYIKNNAPGIRVKSGIMLGLGETGEDIRQALKDLVAGGVDILTMGQYLSPSKIHYPTQRYYTPREFKALEDLARSLGIKTVKAAPLVRSSYRAGELYHENSSSSA